MAQIYKFCIDYGVYNENTGDRFRVCYVSVDYKHIYINTSRRFDGAYPNIINPRIVWEIKEYYYATTFGSRVADGVYIFTSTYITEKLTAKYNVENIMLSMDIYF